MVKNLSIEEENKIINKLIQHYSKSNAIVYYTRLSLEEKANKNIILTAIKLDCSTYNYIPCALKNNREFTLEAVKQNGIILKDLLKSFMNDEEIVLEAIKQDSLSLNYVSDYFLNNRNFIFKLIDNNINYKVKPASILHYLPYNIKYDREIVLKLIKSGSDSLFAVAQDLCNDREFVLEVVKYDGDSFMFASKMIRADRQIILESIKTNTKRINEILENFNEKFISFVQLNYKNHYELKSYLPDVFKNDREIILALVKQDGTIINIASDYLQNDKEIIKEAMKRNLEIIDCAYSKLNDENIKKFQKWCENKYDLI